MVGRRKPYTALGISRVPCTRCGRKPAAFQWNCCANGNRWMPICESCDIDLNRMVLRFFKFPNWRTLLRAYIDRLRRNDHSQHYRPTE